MGALNTFQTFFSDFLLHHQQFFYFCIWSDKYALNHSLDCGLKLKSGLDQHYILYEIRVLPQSTGFKKHSFLCPLYYIRGFSVAIGDMKSGLSSIFQHIRYFCFINQAPLRVALISY